MDCNAALCLTNIGALCCFADLIKGGRPILDAAMVLNFFVLFLFPIIRLVKSRSWYHNYSELAAEKEATGSVNEIENKIGDNSSSKKNYAAVLPTEKGKFRQRQGDSDDESLHSTLGEEGIEFTDIYKPSTAGMIPAIRRRVGGTRPPPAGVTYDSQFTKAGDQLTWIPTMDITIGVLYNGSY